ncbi:toxin-antitoxin system YwqK family antitoxin [Flavobacterium columnare]|uniref:MORN repeat variant n=1 Tax=Flavobacterium columnare TaxID=996 RepID=A0AAI8CH70_9FLAO|nr:hypothetical protein [Flavobacterium columnare]AMO21128.1 hypothetical protein UN65_13005 [Flavobacterium columnare]QOG58218.1 hypothetical protein HUE29_13055 [Flavobacterium columnare]QOG60941.1 hypothetical protein HUE30_13055 [Flavobacterium columnare]QOG63661.1 hypothetical protein HUE31_13055 [Flavobacterium columnare]QOG66385.1 hypothetical protein HUE32_13065 [Flavobacterium columnare]
MKREYKRTLIILIIVLLGLISFYFYSKNESVYILKEYSPNGKLIGTNEYVLRNGDTIMHGQFVNYNENGIKISEGQFVNNEPNGLCTYYDENGIKEVVHYRKNSNITLESTFYNPKGFIEKYVVYDDLGKSSFIIGFDEKGVTKYNGYFQIETYQYKFSHPEQFKIKEQQYLKVGDKLKYSYLIANIPNAKRSFKIENISVDNSKVKRTLKHIEPCQWDVEEILTKKGKNTIRSIVKYEFKDKVTPVFIDTLSFDIEVLE